MAEKMTMLQGDRSRARHYQQIFEQAQASFIEKLWGDSGRWGYFKLCTEKVWDADAAMYRRFSGFPELVPNSGLCRKAAPFPLAGSCLADPP